MHDDPFPGHNTESHSPPSKSALKREMDTLRKKAEALVNLSDTSLSALPLPEKLREAILLARKLKKNDARRRQVQYITKQLKLLDMTAIDALLEKEQQRSSNFRQRFHKIERWRDQLLENGDSVINQLMEDNPQLDRQHLRQLIRQARQEASKDKPPAASRKIFKYLQENLD